MNKPNESPAPAGQPAAVGKPADGANHSTARMRSVTSGDVRLAVFESGDPSAPTVLLVHGYPDTHAVWDQVVERLADRFHVVTYDVRGAGVSSVPRGLAAYRLPRLAEDLFAVVSAVSPDRPVHLVAHDWGSLQSWEAVTEPGAEKYLASYTSISGPCLDQVGHWMRRRVTSPTPKNLGQALGQLAHSWYIFAFHLPVLMPLLFRLVLAPRWGKMLERFEDIPADLATPTPTFVDDAVNGIALYRANMLPRLLFPRPRSTEIPVRVIQPEGDHFVRAQLTEDLERWVSRLDRRSLPAKHWAQVTHPDEIAKLVVEHIEGSAH